eukprot:g5728.t1
MKAAALLFFSLLFLGDAAKITVNVDVDPATACRAGLLKNFGVDQWRNGVVGYDSPYAIYGSDDLENMMNTTHEWSDSLKSGIYSVDGKDPLLYVCAFSPSANTYPLPPPKDWRMCGCCYQFNPDNATNFEDYCSDTKGTCSEMCTVTQATNSTAGDRYFNLRIQGQGPKSIAPDLKGD